MLPFLELVLFEVLLHIPVQLEEAILQRVLPKKMATTDSLLQHPETRQGVVTWESLRLLIPAQEKARLELRQKRH